MLGVASLQAHTGVSAECAIRFRHRLACSSHTQFAKPIPCLNSLQDYAAVEGRYEELADFVQAGGIVVTGSTTKSGLTGVVMVCKSRPALYVINGTWCSIG